MRQTNSWQERPMVQVAAAAGAVVPMLAIGLWMYIVRDQAMTLQELLLGPLLCGGALIFWILFLHLFVCGDSLDSLGFRARRPLLDLGLGIAIGVGMLIFHSAYGATVARWFPPRPPAEEMLELLGGLSRNPWLLALWLGPVVWIGVAAFEELWRVFVLRRLWKVWDSPAGRWTVIVGVSALVGLGHGYQGPAAILSIGLMSVFKGWFFLATGRVRALIVAHAVYDSVQIVMAVIAIRGAGY